MDNNWYKRWFNSPEYLTLYKHRDDKDAGKTIKLFLKNVKLPVNSKCLDLACGNGRHSLLFAKEGFFVTGLDLSPFLIRQAEKRLSKEYRNFRNRLSFVIRDMRSTGFKNEFDLVVNLFSSFGYFEKQGDNLKVIRQVSRSLKKGGYFLFDFLNKDRLINTLVPYSIKINEGMVFIEIRYIKNSQVNKDIIIIKNNKAGKTPKIHQFLEKIQLYSLNEFRKMFTGSGLKIIKVFGNYEGEKFQKLKSERLIILAQKI